MKNIRRLLVPLLFAALFFTSCKDKCGSDDFGIESLQPAANPAGYEVFIKASGVTSSTKVYFDEVEAASTKTAEGGLIVKVPAGVAGTVSLSIEEGDCSDSRSFDVLGSYPGNVPPSPTSIIIPQAPGSLPGSISNAWENIFDSNHKIVLGDFVDPTGVFDGSFENYITSDNEFLTNNPISGNYDIQDNTVFIVIDRTDKPGGYKDTLTGQLIPNLPDNPDAESTMLLTSNRTGRQLVIFK